MSQRTAPPELAALRRWWRRWTAILELFARRRRRRRRVQPSAYAELHGRLLLACRLLAAADPSRQVFCQELEDLVRPWMTPRSLERTDPEILQNMAVRCRLISQTLDPWGERVAALRNAAWLLPWLAAASLLLMFPDTVGRAVRLLPGWLFDLLDQTWFVLKHSSADQKLLLVVAIVILISIRVVARAARG